MLGRRAGLRRRGGCAPDVLVDLATLTGANARRARQAHRRAVQRRTTTLADGARRGRRRRPASRCGGCRWPTTTSSDLAQRHRRPATTRPAPGAGLDRRPRCTCASSPATLRDRWAHIDMSAPVLGRRRRRRAGQGRHRLGRPHPAALARGHSLTIGRVSAPRALTRSHHLPMASSGWRWLSAYHGRFCRF